MNREPRFADAVLLSTVTERGCVPLGARSERVQPQHIQAFGRVDLSNASSIVSLLRLVFDTAALLFSPTFNHAQTRQAGCD